MSLIEDARQLLLIQPVEKEGGTYYCRVCGEAISGYPEWAGHASDCSWLSMPKIVAALEAAQAAVDEWGEHGKCPFCGPRLQRRPERQHGERCPWMVLVVALKGDA